MPTPSAVKHPLSITGLLAAALAITLTARAEEPIAPSPWSVSLAGGMLEFEGDVPVADAPFVAIRIGRDYDPRWTFEGEFALAPEIDENWRTDWRTGERVSRLEEAAGPGVHDTWSIRITTEALYHLGHRERLDPYLAAGIGGAWSCRPNDNDFQPLFQTGAGCLYHLRESWALRADVRVSFSDQSTEANGLYFLGLQWTPASQIAAPPTMTAAESVAAPVVVPAPPPAPATAAPVDTDGDGLSDEEEINTTHTDPLLADTDYDALSDGDEVRKHHTDPLKRDTDSGGVYDGHEVIEDGTLATERLDDLMVFELQFDYEPDDWKIKSEYYSEIAVIGNLLKEDPTAKARIEGHVDVTARDPLALSEQRAEAVHDALVTDWGIDPTRLTAVGYSTSRPKGPNLPPAGNSINERVEVYLPVRMK
ncbi:MAG: OmpA family protein [Verrucomicrobia bacterium]|nr:OmpA family protein [Verrucomicrobiota bacterium]